MKHIPKTIKVLPENPYAAASEQNLATCRSQGFKFFIFRLFCSSWSKLFGKGFPAKLLTKKIGKISGSYDIAISYSQPIADHDFCNLTNEIVLDCCPADYKITFLHCDFASYGGNTARNRRLYRRFDAVAAVSDSVKRCFLAVMPEMEGRVFTVRNCCDSQEILRLSNENPVVYNRKCLVTVVRLSKEKGLLRCIPLFKRLKEDGFSFEWHIIGGGPLYQSLGDAISEYGMNDCIFLEGEQINPYRFLKNADYFFLPSYHEAAPIVFDEAMCLGLPILTTRTLSADELVSERKIGIVCDNSDDKIYDMLKYALNLDEKIKVPELLPDNMACITQFDNLCSYVMKNKESKT